MTNYNLGDRFKELSSYIGIAVVVVGTALPQLLTPAQMIAVLTPIAAVLGTALFFFPEDKAVITADHVFAALMKVLPSGYRVAAPPIDPAPAALAGFATKTTPPAPVGNGGSIASVGTIAAMLALLFVVPLVSGCTSAGQLTPQALQIIGAACKIDGLAQPIAVSVVPTLVPQASPIASIDNALVHPAVVKACDAVGGTPVAVTTAPVPVTAATAPAVAPAVVAPPAPAAPDATAPAAKN